jgi:hypothetical protein
MLALLAGGVVASAQTPPIYLLRSGTIVDSLRGYAYVAEPNGSVQAVDLRTGGVLWSSRSASLPLGANDSYVAAQEENSRPGTLSIVFLDIRNGSAVSQANIPLPANVVAMIAPSFYGSFFVTTAQVKGRDFELSWFYDYRGSGDACCPPEILYSGSADVDPRTGAVLSFDGGLVADYPAWYGTYGATPAPPWRAGNVMATMSNDGHGSITLKRSSIFSGQAFPDVLLSSHANSATVSVDQRYVWVEEKPVSVGFPSTYPILIFETESGERIGDFLTEFPNPDFVVFDGAFIGTTQSIRYYLPTSSYVPPTLAALSLPTGAPKWSVPRRAPEDATGPKTSPPLRRSVRH